MTRQETTSHDHLPDRLQDWADGNLRVRDCKLVHEAVSEIQRLRKFVQWTADHSNDPAVVAEARKMGARA